MCGFWILQTDFCLGSTVVRGQTAYLTWLSFLQTELTSSASESPGRENGILCPRNKTTLNPTQPVPEQHLPSSPFPSLFSSCRSFQKPF